MLSVMSTADASLVSLIGERVRARRNARGWTLDQLADRSGVSRRMLVNVEQGVTNASIATLLRLSEALGIGLPSLVAPSDGDAQVEVRRAGTRSPLWAGEHGGEAFLAAGVTGPDVVELWDWSLAPGDAHASEPHVAGTRELLTVTEGKVVLTVAGEEVVLHPGDAASFHGDVVHGYRNGGAAAARFALTVYEPAGPR
jgi:transcriptional regulator with XRE-family HTH domain